MKASLSFIVTFLFCLNLFALAKASSASQPSQNGQAIPISPGAGVRVVQILHVNDLHSYWETSEYQGFGGYPRLKALIDQLQEQGHQRGWTTIRLDAGDFSDGNINFISNRGKPSFVLERMMNFDVIALGNHDYLRGMEELAERNTDPAQRLPLVAANVFYPRQTGIEPGRIVEREGLRIAVAGASVKSVLWNWAAWPAQFVDPEGPVDTWLSTHPADLHIALTHLGYDLDEELARKSRHIDIIVGGHSHTPLFEPLWVKNRRKRFVPIVQAGSHGMYVGELVVKLEPLKAPQVVSYQLHPVTGDLSPSTESTQQMDGYIKEKRHELSEELGIDLTATVAQAHESFFPQLESAPLIGNFIADALREAAHSDLAADSPFSYGERLTAGPLTVGDIFNFAPHLYYWSTKGWDIYTCDVSPVNLAMTISYLAMKGIPLAVSGIHIKMDSDDIVLSMVGDNGRPLDWEKKYTMAMSEGFGQALTTSPLLEKFLCTNEKTTNLLVRDALLAKASKMGTISHSTLGQSRISGGSHRVVRQ